MADTWQINRQALKNKNKEVKESAQLTKAEKEALDREAIHLFNTIASGSGDFGNAVSGFITKAASVKPRGNKVDPTPALASGTIGKDTSNVSTPSTPNKAAIDAITGKTSKEETIIKKAIANGSPEGIRAAAAEVFKLNEDKINEAVEEANTAADDPEVQEQLKKIGLTGDDFKSIVSELTSNVGKLTSIDQKSEAVKAQKTSSIRQMKVLNNPIGSFKTKVNLGSIKAGTPVSPGSPTLLNEIKKANTNLASAVETNPFGSMGVDFSNIQSVTSSLVSNVPTFNEVGKEFPAISKNKAFAEGFTIDNIPQMVKANGSTNLSNVISKGSLVPNLKPSVPVEEIGTSNSRPVEGFLYTRVISSKEIELDVASVRRDITYFITGWNGSTLDQKSLSAKNWNTRIIERNKNAFISAKEKVPIETDLSGPAHYFILKDGSIERVLPLDLPVKFWGGRPTASIPQAFQSFPNIVQNVFFNSAVMVIFDAGYNCTKVDKSREKLDPKSITREQWEAYDKLVMSFIKVKPGILISDLSEVGSGTLYDAEISSVDGFGPGFNSANYAKKFDGVDGNN
jgi:hypothetical protein